MTNNRIGDAHLHSERHSGAREAAILFSAGLEAAAIQVLEDEIADDTDASRQSWLVLLDLYVATGKRDEFDAKLDAYGKAFPDHRRPVWGTAATVVSPGTLALAGTLDRSSGCLSRIVDHAAGRRTFALDMSQVQRISFDFAGEFTGALRGFHIQGKRVILANVSELQAVLLEALGADSQSVLMLRKGTNVTAVPLPAHGPVRALAIAA